MVIVFPSRRDPVRTLAIRRRMLGAGAAYLLIVAGLLAAAAFGVVPGAKQVGSATDWLGHPYRLSMAAGSALLAAYLGFWSAQVGRVTGHRMIGLGILVAGGVVTGIALAFAPMILYPNDRYPVTFLWLVLGAPVGLLTWLSTTLRRRTGRPPATAG